MKLDPRSPRMVLAAWILAVVLGITAAYQTVRASEAEQAAHSAQLKADFASRTRSSEDSRTEALLKELENAKEQIRDLTRQRAELLRKQAPSSGEEKTEPPPSNLVASFTGSGIQNTRPFQVDGPWEIRWKGSGDIFQIYVYTRGGDVVDVAANQSCPCKGASYQPSGGSFYPR